jgi:hypothetical protein
MTGRTTKPDKKKEQSMNVTAMGRAGLTGVPGRIGQQVAGPVSERTPLSREQVEALFGALLLAYAIYRFAKAMAQVWRAGQEQAAVD